jgi:hypothetical protein
VNPAERVLRARLAAYTLHAKYDARETTTARAAFMDRFEREVDPDGQLSVEERQRRAAAAAARKAYFTRLALRSAQARRGRSVAARRSSSESDARPPVGCPRSQPVAG